MFYTYLHIRESDNKPFYIGKGQGKRASDTYHRSNYWKRVVAKHGLKIQILAEWPEEKMALEHEKFLIACFKDMGHNLINMTDGGEGLSGYKHKEETKRKMSSSQIGKKVSEETRQKQKKPKSEEHKKNLSIANTGKKASEHTTNKMSASHKKRYEDPAEILKLSISKTGKKRPESFAKKMANKIWINNGIVSNMIDKDLPLPEGFVLGRVKKATA